ncbi:MAG TPA: hypothetical protein P5340_04750 [Defluviicoccus sp.]|nr:hypothetical protein [Defluviicoccus sp.]
MARLEEASPALCHLPALLHHLATPRQCNAVLRVAALRGMPAAGGSILAKAHRLQLEEAPPAKDGGSAGGQAKAISA